MPEDPIFDYPEPEQPKRRGRPKGAVNKRLAAPVPTQLEKEPEAEITVQGLPPKTIPEDNGAQNTPSNHNKSGGTTNKRLRRTTRRTAIYHYVIEKEYKAYELAIKYRQEGKIRVPGKPFEESTWREADILLAAGML
ncbi:hypothetical protein MCOR21_011719 [Pyricularia oryzae]|nr:hypothetical protein MCOR21_011719 [Pyricularia oryzae]